ncbi:unnamed protein product, partial [marine sediment metagenome]
AGNISDEITEIAVGDAPGIDANTPTISFVSVSPASGNTAMVLDEVVITILAGSSETGLTASGTQTVNGVESEFAETSSGNYTITYTVAEGNNNIIDDTDPLPVSIKLKDAAGNISDEITEIAVGDAPGIDANTPTISFVSVSPASGNTAMVLDEVVITILAGSSETGLTASGTQTVNGVESEFAETSSGNYTITYTVAEGNNNIIDDTDPLPVSIKLKDAAGNISDEITEIAVGDAPGIDANTPTISFVSVSPASGNTAMVLDEVVITILAGSSETGLTASGTQTVNGVESEFAE